MKHNWFKVRSALHGCYRVPLSVRSPSESNGTLAMFHVTQPMGKRRRPSRGHHRPGKVRRRSPQSLGAASHSPISELIDLTAGSTATAQEVSGSEPPTVTIGASGAGTGVLDLTATVASEVAKGLADNVQMELTAVREAITAAEVKAVAAEARTDALRAEKGRLEAQLKRAEADTEYWRSQHDRLDRDLDRERGLRTSADKAKAVAESETREVRQRVAELSVDLNQTQTRERGLIAAEASLSAELDQANMAMGWWSRRRLDRLRARSAARTPPAPAGE